MANDQLAQTYAQAVFEEALAQWLAPLRTAAAALEQAGLTKKLDDAAIAFSQKQTWLRSALPANTPKPVENFLLLLTSKNHTQLLDQVIGELDRFSKHAGGGVSAKVTSAIALSAGEKAALETKMRAQFGQDLSFDYNVDASILGGVVVRVGDKVIDGSVAGKLAALQEKLK